MNYAGIVIFSWSIGRICIMKLLFYTKRRKAFMGSLSVGEAIHNFEMQKKKRS